MAINYSELDDLILQYIGRHPNYIGLMRRLENDVEKPLPADGDLIESIKECCEHILEDEIERLYHDHKVQVTFDFYKYALKDVDLHGKIILDFGCGIYDALAISILLWANGAQGVVALDASALFSPKRTSRFLYDFIVKCLIDPSIFLWGNASLSEFRDRLLSLNLKELKTGCLSSLFINAPILHVIGDIQTINLPDSGIDCIVSQSVIEHAKDCEQTLSCINAKLVPGGLFCCAIDFRDHRLYAHGNSPWQYLVDDGDYYPEYINKIRYSRMMEIFDASGFDILGGSLVEEEPPVDILNNLLYKYKHLSESDIRINACYVVFRKRVNFGSI